MSAAPATLAADLYPPSLKDTPFGGSPALWSGLYAGGSVGGVWSGVDVTDTYTYGGDPTAKNSVDGSGFIGGGQLGYSIQRGNFVYGIEGDLGYLNLSGSKSAALPAPPNCPTNKYCGLSATYSSDGGMYGDIAARLGYAYNRTLFYVKGGVAYMDADYKANYVGDNCSLHNKCGPNIQANSSKFNYSHDASSWGWTIGAGVEYSLSPAWSLKAEYQHFDFGRVSYSYDNTYNFGGSLNSHLSGTTTVSQTADAVKLGVNYQFGRGGGQ
jgi:outer membrane immunogenic protein